MTEVHVCLFPELLPEPNSDQLRVNVYDQEDDPEVGERTLLATLEKISKSPGWIMYRHEPIPGGDRIAYRRVGSYRYIEVALRDLAYLLGQYWSPTRS